MKREVSTLLQFIIIIGLVSSNFYLMVTFIDYSESITEIHNHFLKIWIYSFVALSVVKLGILYFTFRTESYDLIEPNSKYLLREISKTIQYLIIAVISIFVSFGITIQNFLRPGLSINISSLWDSMKAVFLGWIIAFSILSLLRLGIIYIVNVFFPKNR